MKTIQHTPTPLHIDHNGAGVYYLRDAGGNEIATFATHEDGLRNEEIRIEDAETRAFIVRCVNSHSELLEALKRLANITNTKKGSVEASIVAEAWQAISKAKEK